MQLSSRFIHALAFSADLHLTQTRKGSETPYVAHILSVAALVLEYGGTEDEAIAALLHDAVEDQGGRPTLERIRERFGDLVAGVVEECTDADVQPKPAWRPRKEAYVAHLAGASPSARTVTCADKLHNARTILADLRHGGVAVWERFKGGRDGSLWYYRAVVEALRRHGQSPMLSELERTVKEIERLAG